jgi:type II secretory pathway pseudopilin PulG
MMRKQLGITVIEISMALVVFAILAVVAVPQFSLEQKPQVVINQIESANKVKSAFALAIAQKGDFPTLSEIVDYIDADFASETNDLSGIMFRDHGKRLTINTYSNPQCNVLTNLNQPGVSDIVRCVKS